MAIGGSWGVCGTCRGGPWDGFQLADAHAVVPLASGCYRFPDGARWWRAQPPRKKESLE
jgi:hypothetical protein